MIVKRTLWGGRIIGRDIDVEEAVREFRLRRPSMGSGCFRWTTILNGIVYKVAYDPEDNIREFDNMRSLSRDKGCRAASYATPCNLWHLDDGNLVLTMPYYGGPDGSSMSRRKRNEFVHVVRHHNAQGHAPIIADMKEDNYRETMSGQIKINDMNLDLDAYSWLIETETSGRLDLW